MKRIIFIGWIITVLLCGRIEAKDFLLKISDNDEFYNPANYISYFIDKENSLEFSDVLRADSLAKFTAHQDNLFHLPIEKSSSWVKFDIINEGTLSPYLEINSNTVDTLEYFLLDNSGRLLHHEITGNYVKVRDRSLETSTLLINMRLEEGQLYTCYLKIIQTSGPPHLPLRIASLEKFYESMHAQNLWHGIYFGLIAFLFIYNIFLFLSIRDTTYLYFAFFIGCTGLLFSLYNNIGKELIWDQIPPSVLWESIVAAAASSGMILFSSRFLNSRLKTPKIHLWLLALIFINIPFIIIGILGWHNLAIELILYNSAMSLFFLMSLAIKSWNSGYQPAKLYLLAWSFHVIGVILSLLVNTSLLSIDINISHILQASSTVSIFFMSFALSKKINVYIETRDAAREMALKTAMENEKLISYQNQQLEAKVQQRTIDLEQSISTLSAQRKDLQEANVFKDKIFSIISHDLKSPISSLAGLLQIMKMKTLNEEERGNAINSLEIALKGTKSLLDNVLAWASKNQTKTEETEEIELKSLVDNIFQIFHFQAEKKGITLNNLIDYDFHIVSNKDMLQLVIRNLISNALKFTKKNGMVDVGMRQDFLNVEIFVKDTGVGMSEQVVSNLFKSNKHNSTRGTENEKGTGLGLILCKEFVEKYNGSIHVKSEIKKGSTFTLKLNNAVPVLETVMN